MISNFSVIAQAVGAVLNLPEDETVAVLMAIGSVATTGEDERKANPFPKLNMTVKELVTFVDQELNFSDPNMVYANSTITRI